jgi:ferredoxin-thioredoxin reductase catalytic chain
MNTLVTTDNTVEETYERLKREAESSGYRLHPDREFTRTLIRGLMANQRRYGYLACPCRLASGREKEDLAIECPCDYRDPDLSEYGQCYCGLYVTDEMVVSGKTIGSIPERRFARETSPPTVETPGSALSYAVWRCSVCGYLCARDEPPAACPICKARKERFGRFM